MIKQLDIVSEASARALYKKMLSPGRALNIPQQEALLSYHTFLSETADHDRIDKRRAYLDMATGTGKTGLFSVIIRHSHAIATEQGYGSDFKTIIVEPTTLLLKQTHDELVAVAPELKNAIGFYGDGTKNTDYPITIMTYHAWMSLMEGGHLKGIVDFQVDDESHYSLSDRRQKVSRNMIGNTVRLGLTASAQYDNQKTMEVTHQNLLYKISLRDAIERGFLTDYAHVQFALTRMLPHLDQETKKHLFKGDIPLLKQREWSKLVVEVYANGLDEISGRPLHEKIGAIFAANTRHADFTADMLNAHPLLQRKAKELGFRDVAISVHSRGLTPGEQDYRLASFKAGEYMTITGDRKIGPGFDYPAIKFSASYPGNSLVDTVQEVGRSTRHYRDPRTGESQGTVIFEAIPYIGYPDPQDDKKSQTLALLNTRTIYEILNSSFVYTPTKNTYLKKSTPKERKFTPKEKMRINLSGDVTAEIFSTLEDTLLISRMLDKAQEELRIDISKEMRTDLQNKIKSRGNFGGTRLIQKIQNYEREHNLETTGMLYHEPPNILDGSVKTMQIKKWQRLNEVVDSLPVVDLQERISVTPVMLGQVRDKIIRKGGFGYVLLTRKIQEYERDNNLAPVGINEPIISCIIQGKIKTVLSKTWNRVNDALDSMPLIELADRIEVTPLMLTAFQLKVKARGDYGAVNLMQCVKEHERTRGLEDIGLTIHIISRLRMNNIKTIEKAHWERLNEVIANLPVLEFSERVDVTSDMVKAILEKMEHIDGLPLAHAIGVFESQKGLSPVGFSVPQITNILAERIKTIQLDRWRRLEDALDYYRDLDRSRVLEIAKEYRADKILEKQNGTRVSIAVKQVEALKTRIFERGNLGAKRLMAHIESFEIENNIPSVGITAPIISAILKQSIATVDKLQWERLNEVINTLPLEVVAERIELTKDIVEKIQKSMASKGSIGCRRLLHEINKFEKEKGLCSLGMTVKSITGICRGSIKTVMKAHPDRINMVLDTLPDIGERIQVTDTMLSSLFNEVQKRGVATTGKLLKAIHKFEEDNFPDNRSGITNGILSAIFGKTVKTILFIQWERMNRALETMPNKNPSKLIPLTTDLYDDFNKKIKDRGNMGSKKLFRVFQNYEQNNALEPSGLTIGILHHLLGGRTKKINTLQWDRLNAVLETVPLVETSARANISFIQTGNCEPS